MSTSALERQYSSAEVGDDATRLVSSGTSDGHALPEDGTVVVATVPKTEFSPTRGVPPTISDSDLGVATSRGLLPVGARVAEFEITRLIGRGGFGVVYEAWDHMLERVVAIKEYIPSSLANRQRHCRVAATSDRHRDTSDMGMRSFINEARLLAQFDHPALLMVYRFWQ